MAATVVALSIAGVLKELGDGMSIAGQPARIVIALAIAAVVAASCWCVFAIFKGLFNRAGDPVGDEDLSQNLAQPPYFCHVIDTVEGARRLTLDVTSKVFPISNIPLDVVEAAQQHNNRRLIALVERSSERTVGWATVWPVNPEAGRAVENGSRPDDELVLADLLPRSHNRQAQYVVVLAVGLLESHRNLPGSTLLRKLGSALLWHIHNEFYEDEDGKSLKILAIGDSPAGRRMCERIGLQANGAHAKFANVADPKPVYCAVMTRRNLREKIDQNFS